MVRRAVLQVGFSPVGWTRSGSLTLAFSQGVRFISGLNPVTERQSISPSPAAADFNLGPSRLDGIEQN